MMSVLRALLVAFFLKVSYAIYPDDHWTYSTQLTSSNYEKVIESEIDAGKTVFVRYIASPG